MRLSDLYAQVRNAGTAAQYFELFLAQADSTAGDDIDVHLAGIGWVELNYELKQARLFPQSAIAEGSEPGPLLSLQMLLRVLPPETGDDFDFTLVVELPLDREALEVRTSFNEVHSLHIGFESEEAWYLSVLKKASTKTRCRHSSDWQSS